MLRFFERSAQLLRSNAEPSPHTDQAPLVLTRSLRTSRGMKTESAREEEDVLWPILQTKMTNHSNTSW